VSAYLILTASAFTGQSLLFVPIVPLLISAGALASYGEMDPAAAVAALTVYDMVKAADKGMRITDIRLTHKSGGKSGTFEAA
jgi:hypothetical protein